MPHVSYVSCRHYNACMQFVRRFFNAVAFVGILIVLFSTPVSAYEGFGTETAGGNAGAIAHVTNLNDSGAGSLRNAIGNNRRIVFDVAGVITLVSPLEMRNLSHITIDGSTAPAPGITLRGYGIVVRASNDIIITHLRIRDTADDGILVWDGSSNVVLDHNSVTNGGDETISITEDTHDVTLSWNIIGDTRSNWYALSTKGTLIANFNQPSVRNITLHHNLYANMFQRSPQISTAGLFDFRNNVIKEWGSYGTRIRNGAFGNIVNNVYQSSRKPSDAVIIVNDGTGNAGAVHIAGNTGPSEAIINALSTKATPYATAFVTTDPVSMVFQKVLAGVGALPRDAIDASLAGPLSSDTIPPIVSITAPLPNTLVADTVTITAAAIDPLLGGIGGQSPSGIQKVEFFVDNSLKATDTTSPYSFSWDTTNGGAHPCNGSHTHSLTAKAYDTAGNTETSDPVSVNMNNPSYCTVVDRHR
jgi:pectate lyase